jgi:hypothetical protein
MAGQLANTEMARVAGLLVSDLAAKGLVLDYTPDSLCKVDQLLANHGHSAGNADRNMGLIELVGAYFGEVFRRGSGGDWYELVPPDNATGLLLDEASDCWVWCHAIIYKQLEHGNKRLAEIYPQIVNQVNEFRRERGAS